MDKRMMLKLNGGRTVVGILRGFDPFMNVVIDETVEECRDGTKNNIGMVVSNCIHSASQRFLLSTILIIFILTGNSRKFYCFSRRPGEDLKMAVYLFHSFKYTAFKIQCNKNFVLHSNTNKEIKENYG